MLLKASEVHVQLMKGGQEGAEGRASSHLGKGIDILGEALATIAELAIGTGDIGVGVVNIAREEHTGVYLTPVAAHLLAVFTAGVEVGDLVGTEDVVHVLGQFCLQRGHDGKLLPDKNLCEQVVGACEDHGLLLEVLDMGTLGEEFRHIAYLMAGLAGEHVAGAGKDGSTDKDGHIGEIGDELLHQGQILGAVILCGYMYLQESDVYITQIIVVTFGRVADEKFTLRVVVFQPVFQGSTYEATSDNSDVNHCFMLREFVDVTRI